uniref:Uncharacterized protein n=1 Tax=Streptomyces avermitilis TaxID=33903 RepID=A0A499W018_STRAX|nr:hypothetical protein SAVMC3_61450 [Streptomyces avermitilis]
MVAQAAVADGGDRVQLLLHVVAFAWLCVAAVLAVAVAVDMARAAGHAELGAGRGSGQVGRPWVGGRAGRCQWIVVGLGGPVEPYPRRTAHGGFPGGQFGAAGVRARQVGGQMHRGRRVGAVHLGSDGPVHGRDL